MNDSVIDKLKSIIKSLNKDNQISEISKEADLFGTGLIDSFGIIALIDQIEKSFSISISSEEMTMQNFGTIDCISKLIESKR